MTVEVFWWWGEGRKWGDWRTRSDAARDHVVHFGMFHQPPPPLRRMLYQFTELPHYLLSVVDEYFGVVLIHQI